MRNLLALPCVHPGRLARDDQPMITGDVLSFEEGGLRITVEGSVTGFLTPGGR